MRHLITALVLLVCGGSAGAHPIDENKVIDLTYSFDEHTIYWPTAKPFQLEVVSAAKTTAGFWYAANNVCFAEHGGTHMDAPIHFAEGKRKTWENASCLPYVLRITNHVLRHPVESLAQFL